LTRQGSAHPDLLVKSRRAPLKKENGLRRKRVFRIKEEADGADSGEKHEKGSFLSPKVISERRGKNNKDFGGGGDGGLGKPLTIKGSRESDKLYKVGGSLGTS